MRRDRCAFCSGGRAWGRGAGYRVCLHTTPYPAPYTLSASALLLVKAKNGSSRSLPARCPSRKDLEHQTGCGGAALKPVLLYVPYTGACLMWHTQESVGPREGEQSQRRARI